MSKFEKSMKRAPKRIRAQARAIAAQIEAGATVSEIGGRRLQYNRDMVSVPIGRSWRMVVDASGGELTPVSVQSHEDYSNGAKAGR